MSKITESSWESRGVTVTAVEEPIQQVAAISPKSIFNDHQNKISLLKEDLLIKNDLKELLFYRPSWREYFMVLAKIAASRSTCLSRPTGAVLVRDKRVLSTGYNGSMPGVAHCSEEGSCYRRRSGTPDSGGYDGCRSNHAEANAIIQASKQGISTEGAELYATLFPCYHCTKLLAGAGIKKVYYEYGFKSEDKNRDNLWKEALVDAGIEVEEVLLSDEAILKTLLNLLPKTSLRRELDDHGVPTGRIETLHMNSIY